MNSIAGSMPKEKSCQDSKNVALMKCAFTSNNVSIMETSTILSFIGTYIIPLATAAVGWFAGSRKRRNDFLQDVQSSRDLLSSENKRLLEDITSCNKEIVAVRKENEELKASVDRLCS